jgi:hypothetical protein
MGLGHRLTQSIASCSDSHFQSQNPATNSLVWANGPPRKRLGVGILFFLRAYRLRSLLGLA